MSVSDSPGFLNAETSPDWPSQTQHNVAGPTKETVILPKGILDWVYIESVDTPSTTEKKTKRCD